MSNLVLGRLNELNKIENITEKIIMKLLNSVIIHYPEKNIQIKMFREGRSMGYLVDYSDETSELRK